MSSESIFVLFRQLSAQNVVLYCPLPQIISRIVSAAIFYILDAQER